MHKQTQFAKRPHAVQLRLRAKFRDGGAGTAEHLGKWEQLGAPLARVLREMLASEPANEAGGLQ